MSKPGAIAWLRTRLGHGDGPELDMRVVANEVERIAKVRDDGYLGIVVDNLTRIRWHVYRRNLALVVQRVSEVAKA